MIVDDRTVIAILELHVFHSIQCVFQQIMPCTYKRKPKRDVPFDQAYAEVNKRTKQNAEIHYYIPLSTFDRFVAKKLEGGSSFGCVANNKTCITIEERKLITYIKKSL